MPREALSIGQQADDYTLQQFAADLKMSEAFLSDCGIYTAETDAGKRVAIPYRDIDGSLLCTEYRSSLAPGFKEDRKPGPHLYGLGLSQEAFVEGCWYLVTRVEDVLVARLHGYAAVAFRDVTSWPPHWTPRLESHAFMLVADFEGDMGSLRAFMKSPILGRAWLANCPPEERLFELHLTNSEVLNKHWDLDYESFPAGLF